MSQYRELRLLTQLKDIFALLKTYNLYKDILVFLEGQKKNTLMFWYLYSI